MPAGLGSRRPGPAGTGAGDRAGRARRDPRRGAPGGAGGPLLPRHVGLGPRDRRSPSSARPTTSAAARRTVGPLLEGFLRWAADGRPVHAGAGGRPTSTSTCPIPCSPTPTWPPPRATRSATDQLDALVLVDDDDRYWLGEHRVVAQFAARRRAPARRARRWLACWAWEEIELATTIAASSTPRLRLDPPAYRRRSVPRSDVEKTGRGDRQLARVAVGDARSATSASSPTRRGCTAARCAVPRRRASR